MCIVNNVFNTPPFVFLKLMVLLLIVISPATTANTVVYDLPHKKLPITSALELTANAGRNILIADVLASDSKIPFVSISETDSNLGFTC